MEVAQLHAAARLIDDLRRPGEVLRRLQLRVRPDDLRLGLPRRLRLGRHGPLQLLRQPRVLSEREPAAEQKDSLLQTN